MTSNYHFHPSLPPSINQSINHYLLPFRYDEALAYELWEQSLSLVGIEAGQDTLPVGSPSRVQRLSRKRNGTTYRVKVLDHLY
jgi:hypothetical protein